MLKDIVLKNRSYRGYDHTYHFTRAELEDYVDHARLCPSSVNKQPLKYYLAWEEEEVAKIQAETRWARALQPTTLPRPGKEPTAFIVICQDDQIDPSLTRYMKDVGIVAQTMLLAAVEAGKGGCMIGNFTAEAVRQVLSLPASIADRRLRQAGREHRSCRCPKRGDQLLSGRGGYPLCPETLPCGRTDQLKTPWMSVFTMLFYESALVAGDTGPRALFS